LSDYAEMQLILCKDPANREQKRQTRLGDYAEMQLILCKDTIFVSKEKGVDLNIKKIDRNSAFSAWRYAIVERMIERKITLTPLIIKKTCIFAGTIILNT